MPHIEIVGLPGSGKTTVTQFISKKFDCRSLLENPELNPYLPRFYLNPSHWAFHSNMFFLSQKAQQYREISETSDLLVLDSPLTHNTHMYCQSQRELGLLIDDDWLVYKNLYDLLSSYFPVPLLIISLEASLNFIQTRIRMRNRSFENTIDFSYLEILQKNHEKWINVQESRIPVVKFNAEKNDFVAEESSRTELYKQIYPYFKEFLS